MKRTLSAALLLSSTLAWGQSSLVEWAETNEPSANHPAPTQAVQVLRGTALVTYPDRASFDADFPAALQSCEDFEDNLFNDGDIIGFPAPLDSSTDNSVFAAGSINPEFSFEDDPINDSGTSGGGADGLVAVGATAFGTPSDIVVANTFVDSFVVNLPNQPQNIAFDVFSFTAGGTAIVTFFDASDTQIGQLSVGASPSTGGFIGVSSPVPIARIDVFSQDSGGTDEAEGVDNICAAGNPTPTLEEVPVMGVAASTLLALLFVLGMFVMTRRQ